jgi:hypothetical protein
VVCLFLILQESAGNPSSAKVTKGRKLGQPLAGEWDQIVVVLRSAAFPATTQLSVRRGWRGVHKGCFLQVGFELELLVGREIDFGIEALVAGQADGNFSVSGRD